MTSIFTVTAACVCLKCRGKLDGITASGARVVPGITAAANGYPFGTRINIQGAGWRRIQDRMASRFGPDHIDILMRSHEEARRFGRRKLRVTILRP